MNFTGYEVIHGWCTIEKATKLIDIVNEIKPSLCVELGVFGGRSLLPLAWASKNINKSSRVIGIDAWEVQACLDGENSAENNTWWSNINHVDMMNYTDNLMKKYNLEVELWKAKSYEVSDKFNVDSIDILHQDSNHSEEVTCKEVELYWNKVRKNGIWIFDDTNWSTTKKAQDLLVSKGYTEIYNHNHNGQAWKVYKRYL